MGIKFKKPEKTILVFETKRWSANLTEEHPEVNSAIEQVIR